VRPEELRQFKKFTSSGLEPVPYPLRYREPLYFRWLNVYVIEIAGIILHVRILRSLIANHLTM
jgi:hypothetical protein